MMEAIYLNAEIMHLKSGVGDFRAQLDDLDKICHHHMYLTYCRLGGRIQQAIVSTT